MEGGGAAEGLRKCVAGTSEPTFGVPTLTLVMITLLSEGERSEPETIEP
jgi:hypothetical protein